MANPILPLDRFVRNRTGSMSSAVGPAPTTTLFPARIFSARRIRAISTIFSVSASRPGPTVPQASSPSSGSTKVNPRSWRTSTFSRTAGEAYIWLFIAGARRTGASVAITTVESMSSAMPPRIFPRIFAVAGAITRRLARCAREMCPISDSAMRSNRSVQTGFFERVCRVRGVMNRAPEAVRITRTPAPSLRSVRTISHALYAAIPPVTPRTISLPESVVICLRPPP